MSEGPSGVGAGPASLDGPGRVIFNGDDFGRSPEINAAIVQAHREGVLTSASLMVAGDAVDEAVALARANPALGVGLHLVVFAGRAVLPPPEIPHLVDRCGCFTGNSLAAAVRYALIPAARAELAVEIAAQFERFAATGLPLSHVDGHAHMHLHPTVWNLLLPLAERYGARGVRLPRDDLRLAWRYRRRSRFAGAGHPPARSNGAGLATLLLWAAVFAAACSWGERRLRDERRASGGRRLAFAGRVYGLMQTGQMEEGYVLEVLRNLGGPSAELYFHPTTSPVSEPLGPNPGDLATLLSPAVRRAVEERRLRLAGYAGLPQGPQEG